MNIFRSTLNKTGDQLLYTVSATGNAYLVLTNLWVSAGAGRAYIEVANATGSAIQDDDNPPTTPETVDLFGAELSSGASMGCKIALLPGTTVTLKVTTGPASGGFYGYISPFPTPISS